MWRILLAVTFIAVILALGGDFYSRARALSKETPTSWVEDHPADCAIVLTGGPGRVSEGFALLAQKQVRKLIISGVFPQAQLREIFPQWPYYGQLREKDVVLEKRSRTTYGNAQQSLPLVEALHCRDLVLITTTLHMPRAIKTFRAAYPKDFPIYQRSILRSSYRPSLRNVSIEVVKSMFYDLWFY